jgi:hypothetical protein
MNQQSDFDKSHGVATGSGTQPAAHPEKLTAILFGWDQQSGRMPNDPSVTLFTKGITDVHRLSASDQPKFIRLHIPGNFRRVSILPVPSRIGLILNLISDPDQSPDVLGFSCRYLADYKGKILNPPAAVQATSREQVALRLAGIDGLIAPKVARFRGRPNLARAAIARIGLSFPAILRLVGTHSGRVIAIVQTADQLADRLEADQNYILTEFVDARSADGLYHKYRVFFFGSTGVVRHRLVSDQWSVHAADRQRFLIHHPPLIALEQALIEGGMAAFPVAVQQVLAQVLARMGLDFFGIDFTILPDGRVLLFEANATMNFLPLASEPCFAYGAQALAAGKAAFLAMVQQAMGTDTHV